jgi:hypothetical protein
MPSTTRKSPQWLFLILTIPGRQPAARMRVWRKLKLLGAGVLRDGVYVLPNDPLLRIALTALTDEVLAAEGTAKLLEVSVHDSDFPALFDRRDEYQSLVREITAAVRSMKATSAAQATRRAEKLRKEFEAITARDFFPSDLQDKARQALDHLRGLAERRATPDEPRAARGQIPRLDASQYQACTWATRARPWIDRLASAWLIQRFIDPKATIRWLGGMKSRPGKRALGDAVGFDFDGAAFTHIDDKVTFEVLMASFGLESDATLQRLGAIVHYLDVGGFPVPEATTIESVLRGMRERTNDDDRFLAEACVLFDDLYAGYVKERAAQ